MEVDTEEFTVKNLKKRRAFLIGYYFFLFVGALIIFYSIIMLFDGWGPSIITGMIFDGVFLFVFVGLLFLLFVQDNRYAINGSTLYYSQRDVDYIFNKIPYSSIDFSEIIKVERISNKRGKPYLLKVYTDDKIHFLQHEDIIGILSFELKERDMKDLIQEKRMDMSLGKKISFKLKGGKVEER